MLDTAIFALGVIVGLLVMILFVLIRMLRKQHVGSIDILLSGRINEAVESFGRAVEHHVDVNAVVTMVRQLDEQPNFIDDLQKHRRTVVEAAWTHYINTLGAALQSAQTELMNAHNNSFSTPQTIDTRQKKVDLIRRKLDQAITASGQSHGPRPV